MTKAKKIEIEARDHTIATGHKTMFQKTWWWCRVCGAEREEKINVRSRGQVLPGVRKA